MAPLLRLHWDSTLREAKAPSRKKKTPPCIGKEVQLALNDMDAGLSSAGTPLALQHFTVPFLCTLQIQVRRAATPLPMHAARRYPHTTPAVCCHIRQKYPCKSAVRFNPFRVPAFKTGVVPVRSPSARRLCGTRPACESPCCPAAPAVSVVLVLASAFPSAVPGPRGRRSWAAADPSGRQLMVSPPVTGMA